MLLYTSISLYIYAVCCDTCGVSNLEAPSVHSVKKALGATRKYVSCVVRRHYLGTALLIAAGLDHLPIYIAAVRTTGILQHLSSYNYLPH